MKGSSQSHPTVIRIFSVTTRTYAIIKLPLTSCALSWTLVIVLNNYVMYMLHGRIVSTVWEQLVIQSYQVKKNYSYKTLLKMFSLRLHFKMNTLCVHRFYTIWKIKSFTYWQGKGACLYFKDDHKRIEGLRQKEKYFSLENNFFYYTIMLYILHKHFRKSKVVSKHFLDDGDKITLQWL